ncbi:MAG TPA: hypothetical protein VH482_10390 [Thermomicrobiales bacterium]|jgi:hypothetical protein
MFDDGDNVIGLLLLGLCAVAGGVLVWEIVTGGEVRYTGPDWLVWVLAAVFLGGSIYGLARGGGRGRSGGGRRWPDPRTGQGSWWRRLFGGRDDEGGM